MITIINGNIIDAKEQIIAHQVNCKGVMGRGVAKAIKNKYPNVYEEYCKYCLSESNSKNLLGSVQYVILPKEKKIIANLFAQDEYGYNKTYTNYDYLEMCFYSLARKCRAPIAIPYKIGCGLDGGDWDIVYPMIKKIFKDREVILYKYQ